MRVIHVTPYYPPHLGGVERAVEALAVRLDAEVWTSALPSDRGSHAQRPPVVRRHRAFNLAHTPIAPGLVPRLLALPRHALVHVHVAHALWPDLVMAAAAIRGFKVVAHFHLDVDPSGSAGFLLPVYKKSCLGSSLRRADRVIALTPSQGEFLADVYGVRGDRTRVVANAADPLFHALPDGGGSVVEPLRLLFVGRLDPQKNVGRLIRALSLVREPVEVGIVGDGEQSAELRRAAAHMTHVRFVGARHGADLLDWFCWADAFVMASDREGMPLALLEAMAAGLAPIVTDVSDMRGLVGDAGLVVATEAAALAAAIDQVASDRYLLADLRARSRRRGRAYSWDRAAEQVRHVYAELAA